jgi:rhodanese-related sulfurtransferase
MAEIEPYRARPLAVICRTNRMSAKAVGLLREAGFSQALLVADGMLGWRKQEER